MIEFSGVWDMMLRNYANKQTIIWTCLLLMVFVNSATSALTCCLFVFIWHSSQNVVQYFRDQLIINNKIWFFCFSCFNSIFILSDSWCTWLFMWKNQLWDHAWTCHHPEWYNLWQEGYHWTLAGNTWILNNLSHFSSHQHYTKLNLWLLG